MPDRDGLFRLARALADPYRLAPPRVWARGTAGVFAGRTDGQSVDFHDYRQYQPGDDLRRVDWRAYARSRQMHLRLFREEVSPVVEVRLDTSASMGAYPGKESAALFVAAFLANTTLAAEGRPVLCVDGERHAGGEFFPALARCRFDGRGRAPKQTPSSGVSPVRFLVSDFLWDESGMAQFEQDASGCLGFMPLALLSRSETAPAWRGAYRLHDVEDEKAVVDMTIDQAAVVAYTARLRLHREALERSARRHGCALVWWETPDGECGREEMEALVAFLVRERLVTLR
ncbi:MAG: DUF58 domain-containing protein [Planctomycetota bacterium]|jgi:hypothetical protein|nr:DUF58 domain-containing protein [Planctomycetota bacterium]